MKHESDKEPLDRVTTASGIPLKRVYAPEELESVNYEQSIGLPGQFPYARGIYESMYRGRLWTMRQYAGFGTPEAANARFKFLLDQGQTGVSVAFDLPTQLGLDSDDPIARPEVGRVGVAVDTLEDLRVLFDGIPLDKTSVSFTINATAPIILAMFAALAQEQGVELDILRGTVQNDILKEYIARGTWIFPPKPSLKLMADIVEFCTAEMPKFYPISICGYHIREAGADAIQELAITIANAIVYIETLLERGLDIDDFAPRLSFFLCVSSDLFEEVAKFRAARRIWSKLLRDRYHAKDSRSLVYRIGSSCGGSTLTANQPVNNIVRVAYEALAAALGGVQSLFTCAWDEPFSIPSEESALLALRTQQILAHETGVAKVVDPLGGSYLVEHLTTEIEDRVGRMLDDLGHEKQMISLIEGGSIQQMIAESAYQQQRAIEIGAAEVVGVNVYKTEERSTIRSSYLIDERFIEDQNRKLYKIRRDRDNESVSRALAAIEDAATKDRNLIAVIIDAVRQLVTIGEITAVLKDVYGEFSEPLIF
ncbi:MAG: methylmalonyl-CoA mutase [Anaerolineales bacterium]|nr:methylmalonyl-CoA mutase [Anaerolineales bacterium]